MAVAAITINKSRLWQDLLNEWNHDNVGNLISRMTAQTGVTSGGADLVITSTLAGDIIYDVDNDDYYMVSVAATTTIALN